MRITLDSTTPINSRYYFTMWFDNATGYSDKFLAEVKKVLQQSNFPQIEYSDAHVQSGGCMGLFGGEQFDAVHISSKQKDLQDLGCLYKSTEFGNLVHISLLFYTKQIGFFAKLAAMLKSLFSLFGSSSMIKEEEYKEVFNRLLFMSIQEAADKLGVDPLQVEFDSRSNGSSDSSGLSGLMSKFSK